MRRISIKSKYANCLFLVCFVKKIRYLTVCKICDTTLSLLILLASITFITKTIELEIVAISVLKVQRQDGKSMQTNLILLQTYLLEDLIVYKIELEIVQMQITEASIVKLFIFRLGRG